jgi:prepilin-type N-terminal cleavage/methylation domain-containing protein
MRGFTLIEVVTTIAIMTVVMVSVAAFEYNILNSNRAGVASLTNAQEVQALLKTMAKEIRSAESGDDGSYPIVSAGTTTITFYADVDANGTREKIRYYLATTTVYRGVTKSTGSPATYNANSESRKLIVTGVRASTSTPMFQYFDSMYSGTTTPMTYPLNTTSIRLVKITLAIDTDPTKSPTIRTYSTQASLRNLKDNL